MKSAYLISRNIQESIEKTSNGTDDVITSVNREAIADSVRDSLNKVVLPRSIDNGRSLL